jgi:hypothetical protein
MDPSCELVQLETEALSKRSGDWDLVHVEVRCDDYLTVVKQVSELLFVVAQYASLHPSDDSKYDVNRDFEIDLEFWLSRLPSWFTSMTQTAGEGWTIKSWLYWFLSDHEDRDWYWVGTKQISGGSGLIDLRVQELPVRWSALKWSLICAGANYAELVD